MAPLATVLSPPLDRHFHHNHISLHWCAHLNIQFSEQISFFFFYLMQGLT